MQAQHTAAPRSRPDFERELHTLRERYARLENEHRETLAALHNSERRFHDIAEVAGDWIWEMGPDLRFTYFSERFEEVTGVPQDFFLGKTRVEALGVDAGKPPWPDHLKDLEARRPFRKFEYSFRDQRGRLCYFRISGKPIFGPDGAFAGYRGTGTDITEEVTARLRLERTRAWLREAVETMPASFILYDGDDRLALCNTRAKETFPEIADLLVPGTHVEELTRARFQRTRPQSAAGEIDELVQARLEQFRSPGAAIREHHPDGRWTQAFEKKTSDGGTVCIRTDITELKQRENELADLTDKLSEYAGELERSNADLEQFAYIASHDLQEPLRMVASYCQLLERRYAGRLDADADEFIGFAVEGATRMQQLINDLLAYSRIGTRGKAFAPVDCDGVMSETIANVRGCVGDTGARVTWDALPTVVADRTQLIQLFQNLIVNAVKFRSERPPEIHVGARRDGDFWLFSVEDNGIGIESDYLDRIFLIFQRLHDRNTYPGTGIGLAICKKVVTRHGGRIWVESVPGQGTTFHFTLPAHGGNHGARNGHAAD